MDEKLRPLEDLARMVLDAELAGLRRLSDETRRRQAEIARLGAARAARAAEVTGPDGAEDLAFRIGQDARWQAWVAETGRRLSREAAEVAAQREAQRKKAKRAFGQVEALAGLRFLDAEERRMRASRRVQADPDRLGESG